MSRLLPAKSNKIRRANRNLEEKKAEKTWFFNLPHGFFKGQQMEGKEKSTWETVTET